MDESPWAKQRIRNELYGIGDADDRNGKREELNVIDHEGENGVCPSFNGVAVGTGENIQIIKNDDEATIKCRNE